MSKMKLKELTDEPMERLYYERQERRKKAYAAKQRMFDRKKPCLQMGVTGFASASSAAI